MSYPYWDLLHHALDAAAWKNSARNIVRGNELDVGDFAFCFQNTRLRHIFYDFLVSSNSKLTRKEEAIHRALRERGYTEEYARPCFIVGRRGSGLFVVCFLVSLNANVDAADWASVVTLLSIPCGNNQEEGLRSEPPLLSRMLFALPVARSGLVPILRHGRHRQQLAYGELERARTLIRQKVALLKTNEQAIRKRELSILDDRSHPANIPILPGRKTLIPQPSRVPRDKLKENVKQYWFHEMPMPPVHRFLTPPAMSSNIRGVLKAKDEIFADASRYLSSLDRDPVPAFRLPPPVYSPLLRASAAFIRRRILP
ncbi:hypothetical protein DFH06DRAFT_604640 [Mycena polygramma]|nr:hypothetical protein DFH06DRAFT_604640 [Mycena polygramma]